MHNKKTNGLIFFLSLFFLMAYPGTQAIAQTVKLPINFDFSVMKQLMVKQLLHEGESIELMNDASGCSTLHVSDPKLSQSGQQLVIDVALKAELGAVVFGRCSSMLNWQGRASLHGIPVIGATQRSVRFKLNQLKMRDTQGNAVPAAMDQLGQNVVSPFIDQYQIDVTPYVKQLSAFLPNVLPRHSVQQMQHITDSIKLSDIQVQAKGLTVWLAMALPQAAKPGATDANGNLSEQAPRLSQKEVDQLEQLWQSMEALITYTVKRFASTTHNVALQQALAQALLDVRYQLRNALLLPAEVSHDPVRHWFIDSWQRLAPVLRQISLEQSGQEPFLLISLLTATDALYVLDQLGPTIGLDISTQGLRRLGRLIREGDHENPLHYPLQLDPELRSILGFPNVVLPIEQPRASLNFSLISSALAATSSPKTTASASAKHPLDLWVPKKTELVEYVPMVYGLLDAKTNEVVDGKSMDTPIQKMFKHLVLATAWQESCWRQFEIKHQQIVSLRSRSGDTGLMQMNEIVWRGLYNTHQLRWSTEYNVAAGIEVLHHYLTRYALKREEHKRSGGIDNLARSTYSAYNGGPSQTARYRNPKAPAAFKKADDLFWQKYQLIQKGHTFDVAKCLGGEAYLDKMYSTKRLKPAQKKTAQSATAKKDPVKTKKILQPSGSKAQQIDQFDISWLMQQDPSFYTVQLATFSSESAAKTLKSTIKVSEKPRILPIMHQAGQRYIVVVSSVSSKSEAEKIKQKFREYNPWVRQIKEVRNSVSQ